MFRKMSLVGLMIILSASTALCTFISPDSVLGGFTKCTINYWSAKGESPVIMDVSTGQLIENKYVKIISEALYNKNGKIISEVSKYDNDSLMQTIKYAYNAEGYPVETCLYKKDGTLYSRELTFRTKDTIINQRFTTLRDKDTMYQRVFVFDTTLLNRIEHSSMNDRGEDYMSKSIFDLVYGNGNHIRTTEYYNNNYRDIAHSEIPTYKYKYDNAGKIIETTKTDPDGEVNIYYNKYDNRGRLIETTCLQSDGSKEIVTYYKYEDDNSKTEYERNLQGTKYLRWITKYDNKGRIYEKEEFHPSGKRRSIITRKFDDKNRIIEVTQTNPDDTKVGKRTFEYDEFGNLTKNIVYSPTNEPIKTVEFVYSK